MKLKVAQRCTEGGPEVTHGRSKGALRNATTPPEEQAPNRVSKCNQKIPKKNHLDPQKTCFRVGAVEKSIKTMVSAKLQKIHPK
jgi:hypothetical protein